MIAFILGLLGIVALSIASFAFGAVIGEYVSVEALAAGDKQKMKELCDKISTYWREKK